MDHGLDKERPLESSSCPHQPHEPQEHFGVNEHERLLPQTDHEDSPIAALSVPPQPQPQPHSSSASGSAEEESQARRQAGLPENHAAIPIAKLQQLVELCAQILRESRGAKPDEPDIEKDGEAATPRDNTQNLFYQGYTPSLPEIYESKRLAIEEIWNNVSLWDIQKVPLASPEELQSHPIFTLSTPEALHQLLSIETHESRHQLFSIEGHQFRFGPKWSEVEGCILSSRLNSYLNTSEGFRRQKILVVACYCALEDEYMQIGNIQIGRILEYCYKYGVLEQPLDKKSDDYVDHIYQLVECWSLLNRVSYISLVFNSDEYLSWPNPAWDNLKGILVKRKSVEEVLGIELVDLLRILHMLNSVPKPLESSPEPTLRIDDLNIKSLRSLGKLSIRWTSILENHLRLELGEPKTLSVAWSLLPRESKFALRQLQRSVINRIPMSFIEGGMTNRTSIDPEDLDKEVAQSWAFLFATSQSPKKRSQNYEKLLKSKTPEWSHGDILKWQQSTHLATRFDDGSESILKAAVKKDLVSYDRFPVFETRLRQLRHYMDSQKPQSLFQLWEDSRDSLSYYTFWGVIIFGLLSVFLAFFSLAVSVAQTVAAFRALELANPPTVTS